MCTDDIDKNMGLCTGLDPVRGNGWLHSNLILLGKSGNMRCSKGLRGMLLGGMVPGSTCDRLSSSFASTVLLHVTAGGLQSASPSDDTVSVSLRFASLGSNDPGPRVEAGDPEQCVEKEVGARVDSRVGTGVGAGVASGVGAGVESVGGDGRWEALISLVIRVIGKINEFLNFRFPQNNEFNVCYVRVNTGSVASA